MSEEIDKRIDRLYELLPVIYRMRDAEEGYPLKALLRVIAEQVNVVEDDIRRLYDNWFIETAEDWAVPYIGELIGFRPVHEAGEPGNVDTAEGAARNRALIPRREVSNTIRNRRRKGGLALLETLGSDVADWPARAVEYFKLLGWTQNINHSRPKRGRTADVRDMDALDLLDGPFDRVAHTVDVRRATSARTQGRSNIPSVGLHVWRLRAYPVTRTPAYCLEAPGPHCYTFSVLGQDAPLFTKPEPESQPTHIAGELNVPAPIRRHSFERHKRDYYGADKSLAVWARDWGNFDSAEPVPASAIIAADLTDWHYHPPRDHVAVDPVLGRLAFPPGQLPERVRVSYHYGFSADIGGGEYRRRLTQPRGAVVYRVGRNESFRHVHDALQRWRQDNPKDAVIELAESGVHVERIHATLRPDQSLQIRAAQRARPVLRLLDWETDQPDVLGVTLARGSRFTLDGLLITGRAVQIRGDDKARGGGKRRPPPQASDESDICPSQVSIRHCTLVPGWGLHNNCAPRRPAEPSLELLRVRARVSIAHSILGSIQINEDAVHSEPIPFEITDSILDATSSEREALGAPGLPVAHCVLTIKRSTVFGYVQVHAIRLAENSIFSNCLNVARRQLGCMRFCYVPRGCRTPRRYHCQPDLAEQAAEEALRERLKPAAPTPDQVATVRAHARERVDPQFDSVRYGAPDYARLGPTCAPEIKRGADDESEMGVFHDLFEPQRTANLRARLDEYTPADMDAGIIPAS